jgi:macrolide transport system ATP-binding/permease protein
LRALGLLADVDLGRPVGRLSTGQRRRLSLALVLLRAPHVLLLDEPTNHLSPTLVDELTEALRATAAAVVVATHDRRLLQDVADWPCLDLKTMFFTGS